MGEKKYKDISFADLDIAIEKVLNEVLDFFQEDVTTKSNTTLTLDHQAIKNAVQDAHATARHKGNDTKTQNDNSTNSTLILKDIAERIRSIQLSTTKKSDDASSDVIEATNVSQPVECNSKNTASDDNNLDVSSQKEVTTGVFSKKLKNDLPAEDRPFDGLSPFLVDKYDE